MKQKKLPSEPAPTAKTGSTRKAYNTKGELVGERASPKLLPERLRVLPSSFVTEEIEDPDRVHELDDPHIYDALIDEQLEATGVKEKFTPPEEQAPEAPPDGWALNQFKVDLIRLRVLRAHARTQQIEVAKGRGADWGVKYLWFPEDDMRAYEARDGNPPPDAERPKHMRGLNLVIDLRDPKAPQRIVEVLHRRGLSVDELFMSRLQRSLRATAGHNPDSEILVV